VTSVLLALAEPVTETTPDRPRRHPRARPR
jgi:hypothetical protein